MKTFFILQLIIMCACILVGCSVSKNNPLPTKLYESVSTEDFNYDLFYMNTLEFEIADPSVIYAEHGVGAGYFYAFGTSNDIDCYGYKCWRSKDLTHWEYVGIAFQPDPLNTWSVKYYFAPEVIYDEETNKYYMFYNANVLGTYDEITALSVAYSDNVMGPYELLDGVENLNGETLVPSKPVIDFVANKHLFPKDLEFRYKTIDAHPFVDPKTNEKYLYWTCWNSENYGTSEREYIQDLYGMKMKDWFSPDYSTITRITEINKTTVGGNEAIYEGNPDHIEDLNEAPFMFYKDDTYYLTFSVYPFFSENYQVRLAVSNEGPLSGFKKIQPDEGGVVLSTDSSWTHLKSAGHHCFFTSGDQLYIAYHTFTDRNSIDGGRSLAIDEVKFVENSDGILTMHTNGPSSSLQPLPSSISGYKNVIDKASVSASGLRFKKEINYLTDDLIKIKYEDLAKEAYFVNDGKITIEFPQPEQVKAIMVYNSYLYSSSFDKIDSIKLEYVADKNGTTKEVVIKDILFDYDFYSSNNKIYPGSAAIAEFQDLPVKKITINLNSQHFALSEIKVLAATNPNIEYVDSFNDSYEYNNKIILNHYKNEGTVLGSTSLFDASYGWNFTNDSKYITTNGLGESFVYFKDVYATSFYAEGYISTTALKSYPLEYTSSSGVVSYMHDPYPKMGMIVRNEKGCAYFFLDPTENFTNQTIGYTESTDKDCHGWKWGSFGYFKDFKNIFNNDKEIIYRNSYLNLEENYLKLAILRNGSKFYLFLNDVLTFEVDNFTEFGENDLANVGFLGISSPMIIKDYSIVLDQNKIEEMISKLK